MATIEIKYPGDLRTISKHMASGVEILTDAPVDNNGKGASFSPTDLMSASLGCCMLTIMGIAAATHEIILDGTMLKVTKIMASNPRRVSEIIVEFHFADLQFSEHQKLILERAARTCPVALSLHPDLLQTIHFYW